MATKTTAATTAVATQDDTKKAMMAAGADFEAFAGMGMENVTARDLLIPRITILQALSPQVTKGKPEYNEEAKVGQIYDIGLNEILGDSILFLPILFKMEWLEWFPRNTGKGLAAIHPTNEILSQCRPDEKNRPTLPNGNYVAETAQFFGMNLSAEKRLSFLPMASTQLKKSRQWNTLATSEKLLNAAGQEFVPPLFYRAYQLSTQPESNAEGSWVGWKIERGPKLFDLEGGKAMLQQLSEVHNQITSGALRGDTESLASEVGGGSQTSADEKDKM